VSSSHILPFSSAASLHGLRIHAHHRYPARTPPTLGPRGAGRPLGCEPSRAESPGRPERRNADHPGYVARAPNGGCRLVDRVGSREAGRPPSARASLPGTTYSRL
jgi:hypothetical protein